MQHPALRYAAALLVLLAAAVAGLPTPRERQVAGGRRPDTRVCVGRGDRSWVAGACLPASDPGWYASSATRDAWGLPACWWTADADAFARVRGVGHVVAPRLAAFRDGGGPLADIGDVRGVGPVLESAIRAAVTDRCPRVPVPEP